MAVTARIEEQTPPAEELHLLNVAVEGAGKSFLSATGRPAVLFFDFDRKAQTLAGKKNVYALTFVDPAWPTQPSAYSEMLDVVAALEKSRSLKYLLNYFPSVDPSVMVSTAVIDSLATFARSALMYALFSNADIRRKVNIGGKLEIHMPSSWDGWMAEVAMVESILLRLFAIPGLDVIVNCHETNEEDIVTSTEKETRFKSSKVVYPVRYHSILKYFTDIWRLTRVNSMIPQVSIIPTYEFTSAKSAIGIEKIESSPTNPPNIADIIKLARLKAGVKPAALTSGTTQSASVVSAANLVSQTNK